MSFHKIFFISFIVVTNIYANFIDEKIPEILEISKTSFEDLPSRNYEDIVLNGDWLKEIKFSISYPKKITKNDIRQLIGSTNFGI